MMYPIFKDDRQYNSWYCETHPIASAHGTETIIDPNYSHTETSQALLWVEIECFIFSLFCKHLQMSVGHMLVKHYSASSSAQKPQNYDTTMEIPFMPKCMHKTSVQIFPIYVLPHGKECLKPFSTIGNPNGYL